MKQRYSGYGENCPPGFDNINDYMPRRKEHKGWFHRLCKAITGRS